MGDGQGFNAKVIVQFGRISKAQPVPVVNYKTSPSPFLESDNFQSIDGTFIITVLPSDTFGAN